MGTIDCKVYDAEIRCFAIFPTQVSILAHHVIVSIICTQVGANHGIHFITPFIPAKLMRSESPSHVAKNMNATYASGAYRNGCTYCACCNIGTTPEQSMIMADQCNRRAN